jgi:MFS family permease
LPLVALTVPLIPAVLPTLPPEEQISELVWYSLGVPFAIVGALITARRPGNRIGLLLLVGALSLSSAQFALTYGNYGVEDGHPLPGHLLVAWVGSLIIWPTPTALMLLLLLFPDGRFLSRRWRLLGWAAVGWGAVTMVITAVYPDLIAVAGVPNPVGLSGAAGEMLRRLGSSPAPVLVAFALLFGSAGASLVRFRRARGIERQQLKWFAYAVVMAVVVVLLPYSLFPAWLLMIQGIVIWLTVWGLGAAIAVAVLRYRLYDIDRLINRTLVYGLLTALLGAAYAATVLLLGQLFGGVGGDPPSWAVAVSTLAVAALFQPARRRVQGIVDRRFNRRRYNAARTVEGFSGRLRDEIDLDTLSAELLAVVDQTMQPTPSSLWLRPLAQTPSRTKG